jgi:hypothetical protein
MRIRVMVAVILFVISVHAEAQSPRFLRPPETLTHECHYHDTGGCGLTVDDVVNIYGCQDDFYYYNVHRIFMQAGVTAHLTLTATGDFSPFIGVSHRDSTTYFTTATGPRRGSASVNYTPSVSDYYEVFVGPDERLLDGTYRLSMTCNASGANCSPSSTAACVLGGRFRVSVRYRGGFDNGTADSNAQVKSVTGFSNANFETAFFYFNSESNIEMMVKMLDQGNTNSAGQPTVAVLFGCATPLHVELTITDTLKNVTRSYTSSFNSMQGATDFTAFVK